MPLIFPDHFYFAGVTPQMGQFELDRVTRHWKTNGATEEEVLACPTIPKKGDPHPNFPFMFVTDRQAQETASNACALDITYMGTFSSVRDTPILPPTKHEIDTAVMSASSSRPRVGLPLAAPLTVQYYAPSSSVSYFSYGSPGTAIADPPIAHPQIISLTSGDVTFNFGTRIEAIINNFFTPFVIHTEKAPEIVAGKYWQNTSKVTNTLMPWLFTYPAGPHAILAYFGLGYAVGDIVVISDRHGHRATVRVDAPISPYGAILNYTQLTNNFTQTTFYYDLTTSPPTHGPPRLNAAFSIIVF